MLKVDDPSPGQSTPPVIEYARLGLAQTVRGWYLGKPGRVRGDPPNFVFPHFCCECLGETAHQWNPPLANVSVPMCPRCVRRWRRLNVAVGAVWLSLVGVSLALEWHSHTRDLFGQVTGAIGFATVPLIVMVLALRHFVCIPVRLKIRRGVAMIQFRNSRYLDLIESQCEAAIAAQVSGAERLRAVRDQMPPSDA